MTTTVDLPPEVADACAQKGAEEAAADAHALGQHAGLYWIADDYDALLPEDFPLGTG